MSSALFLIIRNKNILSKLACKSSIIFYINGPLHRNLTEQKKSVMAVSMPFS